MAIIALEGMSFFAHHGLYEEEKRNGNHFEVDLKVNDGKDRISGSDDIHTTVDYVELYKIVSEVMSGRVDLLETLVASIGEQVLDQFETVASVDVKVSKLNPPIGGTCVRASVQQIFVRSDVA